MLLSRTTPANRIAIKTPIWGGRKIGIATHKIGVHNEVEILAKDKQGNRIYPNKYYISDKNAMKYPTQVLKNYNVTLYIIPIDDLEPLERE